MESRTQGLRPRTQKISRPRTALPRTDPLKVKDRNAQGQEPRTQAQVFSKKSLQNFFSGNLQKKRSLKNFTDYRQVFSAQLQTHCHSRLH